MGTIRVIAGTIVLLLAVVLFVMAYVTWTEVTMADRAEPVNMEVDFSSPGEYASSFRTTYRTPLGIRLQLEFGGELSGRKPSLSDLDGLEGQIRITDNEGQVVMIQDFTAESFQRNLSMSVSFGRRQDKGWSITVDIAKPATALRNTQQFLTARYLICGLEAGYAVSAVLVGLVFTAVAIKIMRPKKKSESSSGGEVRAGNVS
jgi:hypothetical protein